MITLKAPLGVSSFSHDGVETEVPANGVVTVQDHVAAVLTSHGFKPFDGGKIDGISADLQKKLGDAFEGVGEKFDAQGRLIGGLEQKIDELDRKGLFRALKAMGVVASATLTTAELEDIYQTEAAKRDAAALDAANLAAGSDPAPAPNAASADAEKPVGG